MIPFTFTLTILLIGTIGAAQTDNPMFWLLIGPAPFAVVFTGLVFLRQGFSPRRMGKRCARASPDIDCAVLTGISVGGEKNERQKIKKIEHREAADFHCACSRFDGFRESLESGFGFGDFFKEMQQIL